MLDQTTMIPLGVAVLSIGGASFWLSAVHSKVNSHGEELAETKNKQEKIHDDLRQIKIDLGIIKELLKKEKE